MKIAALTMVYDEALILPYFLRHYEYADEIHVLYETDSTDSTLDILQHSPNVIIKNCHIEGGLDDQEKANIINETLHGIKADWVLVVDPDEFIFAPNEPNADFLKRQKYNLARAAMFQVYRHRTDTDLDPNLQPIPQRIHGDPYLFTAVQDPNHDKNAEYIKPIIIRPSSRIWLLPGNHLAKGQINMSPECFTGAHWSMADPSIAIDRRIKRKKRASAKNKASNWGFHNWNITEEYIIQECTSHLDDPIIDALDEIHSNKLLKSYFYIEDNGPLASDLRSLTFGRIITRIEQHIRGKKLLFIGYSCASFLKAALDRDFDASAVECSSAAISAAESQIQKRIIPDDRYLSPVEQTVQYDVIAGLSIWGQLKDPSQFIQETLQLLKPGGLLVLTTSNSKHWLYNFIAKRWPMIYSKYSAAPFFKKEIKDILLQSGFCEIRIEAAKTVLSIDYLLSQVQEYNLSLLAIYKMISILLPSHIKKKTFAINIGNIIAFAKKTQ